MKIYLDDEREAPEGWYRTKQVDQTIFFLGSGLVTHISLDHDLGYEYEGCPTGYDVLLWIEKEVVTNGFKPPRIKIHSANSSAVVKMKLAVQSIIKHHIANLTKDWTDESFKEDY